MKKALFCALAIVISACGTSLFGQGLYVNVKAGYALPAVSGTLEDFYNYRWTDNGETIEQIRFSLGSGTNVGATIGYQFNGFLSAELDLSYLFGSMVEAKYSDLDPYYTDKASEIIQSQMFRINPNILLQHQINSIIVFMKLGFIMGTGGFDVIYNGSYEYGGGSPSVTEIELHFNEGLAMGWNTAMGAYFPISESIRIMVELQLINMSYGPKKGFYNKYMSDGYDYLEGLTDNERTIEYVDEIKYDFNNPPPADAVEQELREFLPFSSIGLNFGVQFLLTK